MLHPPHPPLQGSPPPPILCRFSRSWRYCDSASRLSTLLATAERYSITPNPRFRQSMIKFHVRKELDGQECTRKRSCGAGARDAGRPGPQLWCAREHTHAPAHRDACGRLTRSLRSCPVLRLLLILLANAAILCVRQLGSQGQDKKPTHCLQPASRRISIPPMHNRATGVPVQWSACACAKRAHSPATHTQCHASNFSPPIRYDGKSRAPLFSLHHSVRPGVCAGAARRDSLHVEAAHTVLSPSRRGAGPGSACALNAELF